MSSRATQFPVAEGRGSVSAAPNLPDGFGTLAAHPEALRGSFEFYRAITASAAQNQERKDRRLAMPVLAMGGEESGGENAANAMKAVADDVQSVLLRGSGHWVAEQAPEALLAALTEFLAPYREHATAASHAGAAH